MGRCDKTGPVPAETRSTARGIIGRSARTAVIVGSGFWPMLGSLVPFGCGGEQASGPVDFGHVNLVVDAPVGLPLSKIDYELQGKIGKPLKGSIVVDELSRTLSANLRSIVAGSGYRLTMKAASTTVDLSCSGDATFDVAAKQTTTVMVPLRCFSSTGMPWMGVAKGFCPLIRSTRLAPTQTSIGGSLSVSVDAVAPPGGPALTYAWSVADHGGTFSDAKGSSVSFTCGVGGDHLITVRVGSGLCADRAMVSVRCVGIACGNGTIDPGETCDDGNRTDGDACPGDCKLPGCGNGKIDQGETCDPPGTPVCDMHCHVLSGCGNGILDPGEECDDFNTVAGDGCSPTCTLEPVCGNGQVEPGEECEPPGASGCNEICRKGPVQ